jgi:hypothetical protein
MDPQAKAELFAELEQRMLEIARNGEKLLRDFNEAYYDAERRKREIANHYHRRRLQRLSHGRAT